MKILFSIFLVTGLLMGGSAVAQDAVETTDAGAVTVQDLGVENVGILPTSPFYFAKEWGRGIQSFFTFNSVAKAQLEAKFTNEKAAEAKIVEEQKPNDAKALERAVANYEKAQERLQKRLEKVQDSSANPNVDRLLNDVADRAVLHEKLFAEIGERNEAVKTKIHAVQGRVADTVARLGELDTPEKFSERVKNALEGVSGGELKHIRSVEFIDRIEDASGEATGRLQKIRTEFQDGIVSKIEAERQVGSERLEAILEKIPGDENKRSVVLEELRVRLSDQAAQSLGRVQEKIHERVDTVLNKKEKAAEQIRRAEEKIQDAQRKTSQPINKSSQYFLGGAFTREFTQSQEKELQSQLAERFGVRIALQESFPITYRIPATGGVNQETCQSMEKFISTLSYIQNRGGCTELQGLTSDQAQQTASSQNLLVSAQEHLQKAKQAFEQENYGEAFGQAQAAEVAARNVLRAMENNQKEDVSVLQRIEAKLQERVAPLAPAEQENVPSGSNTRERSDVVCTQEYKPVCGTNGETYSNRCVAERQNKVKVEHEGQCAERPSSEEIQRIEQKEAADLKIQPRKQPISAPQQPKNQDQDARQQRLEEQLQLQLQQLDTLQKQLQDKSPE
jgi:hypothetical protein